MVTAAGTGVRAGTVRVGPTPVRAPRRLAELALAIASALLYGWAFPPQPHRWLPWIALVPLLAVLRQAPAGRRLALTWVWTIAMAYTVNDWFPRAVSGYFTQPVAVGVALFLGVSTLTAGIQYMGFAAAYPRLAAGGRLAAPFVVAAAWVAADLLRLLLFGGDPWALAGYSQVGVLPLMQIADLTGVHGITFLVVAVNAAIVEAGLAARAGRPGRAGAMLVPVAGALGLVLAYGGYRMQASLSAGGSPVAVGIIQVDLPLGAQWRREFYGRNLDRYLRTTLDVLRDTRPRLVVWPESAMTFFVADEPAYRTSIASVLEGFGAELIAGGPHAAGDEPARFLNSAFLLAPDGEIRGRYDKRLLLPFAEYFPFGGLDLLRRSFGRVREFTPGEGPVPLLATALGPAGVIICNEGFFAAPAAARVRAGATVLVNLSNDSWLADAKYSEPAFDMVRLRAVEQRRWIVRASTAGPSALIDPFGRVVARTRLFETTALSGTAEGHAVLTPYCRVGDLFAWTCAVVTVLMLVAGRSLATRSAPRASRS